MKYILPLSEQPENVRFEYSKYEKVSPSQAHPFHEWARLKIAGKGKVEPNSGAAILIHSILTEDNADPKILARNMVGDGLKPNRYFVTIGFGWYLPEANMEDGDMEQAPDSLHSVTMGPFTSLANAERIYKSFRLPSGLYVSQLCGQWATQIMIEDRLMGVVKERRLYAMGSLLREEEI